MFFSRNEFHEYQQLLPHSECSFLFENHGNQVNLK